MPLKQRLTVVPHDSVSMRHGILNGGLKDQASTSPNEEVAAQAIAAFETTSAVDLPSPNLSLSPVSARKLPLPSQERLRESLSETAIDPGQLLKDVSRSTNEASGTVLYLAYGSNLCAQTFQGKRGIKPISQMNVVVPSLVLTFDLPGVPYVEPCFGNTRYRDESGSDPHQVEQSEKAPLLSGRPPKYHKNRWHKGLVGVVYEVTMKDFAHIIATEGGGASYQDIVIDCHPLPSTKIVPEHPETPSFKAHTLFSPARLATPPDQQPLKSGGRLQRPDTSYAQPSARYLKLITDGAVEHDLPEEYMNYLHQIRPYTITQNKQRLGRFVTMMFWYPLLILIFTMKGMIPNKDGKAPAWMNDCTGAIFRAIWASYDHFYIGLFGDGERTVNQDENQEEDVKEKTEAASMISSTDRRSSLEHRTILHAV
ncbi:MAG: hypothetical protein M1836_004634 [Candelina mexicana]|nr:MAG: hypothetical protein M1836_004634 [Candelina mexicana]